MPSEELSLERLRRQLSGCLPEELDGWLVQPRSDTPYHEGTVVPLLGLQVRQRPSGLLVVGDVTDPAPIDQMAVYLTASEVFGAYLPEGLLDELLEGRTADRLVWATAMLLRAEHEEVADLEVAIVNEVLVGEARERAGNLLASRERRLIAPQIQLLVAAGALLGLPWTGDHPADAPDVTGALLLGLHVGDLLEGASHDDTEILFGNVRAGLAAEVVANQLFNSVTQLRADIARHEAVWHRHLPAVAETEGLPDLAELFENVTGVPLDVFQAVGFGFYAAKSEDPPFVSRSWFSSTRIMPEDVAAIESLVSVTPDELRSQLERDVAGDLSGNRWALQAFSRWPLLRYDESRWLVHSPQLLVDRFFSGLAFFDAWFAAGAERDQVKHAWGLATERYGHEVLRAVAGARVFPEDRLQAAYSRAGKRIADAAVDYGHRWLVLDFSSRRPSQALARGASPEALVEEVHTLVDDKGEQLHDTIEAIRRDETRLTGAEQQVDSRRFTPVVAVHSRWPVNPITHELIQLRLKELDFLQDDDVDDLEVVTIEELEMVEAVQESGGPDLVALLDRKREGPLFRMGLKNHMLLVERLDVGVPRRLGELFEACIQRMVETFGFSDDDTL